MTTGSAVLSLAGKGRLMERWYRVTRTDWIVQNHFRNRWTRAGSPSASALLGRIDVRAGKMTFYFNPEAARLTPDLLELYKAVECDTPNVAALALLVGDQSIVDGPYL